MPQQRALAQANIKSCVEFLDEHEGQTVIGFDLSQKATGVCVLDLKGNLIECYETQVEKASKSDIMYEFANIFKDVLEKHKPIAIGWEIVAVAGGGGKKKGGESSGGGQFTGMQALLHLEGLLYYTIGCYKQLELSTPLLVPVSISAVKKYACGNGRPGLGLQGAAKKTVSKNAVKAGIASTFGHTFASDNEADAYGVAAMVCGALNTVKLYQASGLLDKTSFNEKDVKLFFDNLVVFEGAKKYHADCMFSVFKGTPIIKENEYEALNKKVKKVRKQSPTG
jgi:hypothetical protein